MTFIIGKDRVAADIWEVLGSAGITMEASCTYPSAEGRNVRVVVGDDDAATARATLLEAGFGAIDEAEVLIAEIEVRPGGLGELARKVADSGARLTTLFMATGDRVVIGADDLDKIRGLV
jgi:hypothetical protein